MIAGAVSGIVREMTSARRWRGTTSYSRTRSRKTTARKKTTKSRKTASATRRRTSGTASVEDIFRDILGNLGKS